MATIQSYPHIVKETGNRRVWKATRARAWRCWSSGISDSLRSCSRPIDLRK